MALDHFEWESGDVLVLHLQGHLTLGRETQKLRQLMDTVLASGKRKILLNMAEIHYMDSSGLGEMVAAYTTVLHHGGKLKLMKLAPRVKDIVQLTKVYQMFEVFEDEDTAVRSFSS